MRTIAVLSLTFAAMVVLTGIDLLDAITGRTAAQRAMDAVPASQPADQTITIITPWSLQWGDARSLALRLAESAAERDRLMVLAAEVRTLRASLWRVCADGAAVPLRCGCEPADVDGDGDVDMDDWGVVQR